MTDVSKLVEKLQSQLVMSMFSTKGDLYREQEWQRKQAAEALIAQQQRIEALDGQQDVAQAARVLLEQLDWKSAKNDGHGGVYLLYGGYALSKACIVALAKEQG